MQPGEAERQLGGQGPAADAAARRPGERALIEHIRRRLPPPPSALVVGPGDDAAVFAPERGALQVLTTDAVVEGIHFDLRFSSLSDIGYKALAVNVSDIAAMGARPEFALVSLILPEAMTFQEVDALIGGVLEMADTAGVAIAGGNISRSPGPLVVDVTATGSVRPRRVLTRSGGGPGDVLYVTGTLGAAAAGLGWLRAATGPLAASAADPEKTSGMATCVQRHRRPEPRVRVGLLLGRNRAASACMDLSDGLADGVRQIAESSGTGATIEASALPIDPAAADWFRAQGADPVRAAVSGGDDYELLFAVSRKTRGRLRTVERGARGLRLTPIGELTSEPGLRLRRGESFEEVPSGFTHF